MTDVVLGDDHAVFVDALAAVLTGRGCTVTTATTIEATITAVAVRRPEICLIDRHFAGGRDGVGAVGDLRAASPGTKVVILSANGDRDSVTRAMRAGAAGYIHKTRSVAVLTQAIERVLGGEVVIEVPAEPGGRRHAAGYSDATRLATYLTARERQCLQLLVAGQDTADMVRSLGVSAATVRTHVQALLTKLGVHSRLEAAAFAVRHGLVDQPASGSGLATSFAS